MDNGNTTTICVGQGATFSIAWFPYTPSRIVDVVAKWTLGGTFVNTNSDPNCDLYYTKDTSQLTRIQSVNGTSSTSCWYVDGGQNSASVTLNLTLKDGKQFVISASGQFTVFKPKVTELSRYEQGSPTPLWVGSSLSLGYNDGPDDMSFKHQIDPGNFAGQAGYTQLITGGDVVTHPRATIDLSHGIWLDKGEFIRGRFPVSAHVDTALEFYDAPSVSLADDLSPTSEDVSFSNYLMFQPGGGIWVTLQLITWEVSDSAAYTAGTWYPAGTANITSDAESSIFPDWNNIYP